MSNITEKLLILTSLKKTVFSVNELAIVWEIENKNVLRVIIARAVKDGYLMSLRRGVYALRNVDVDAFELACKMKRFSYISFETVLAQAGVVHQWYDAIFLASNRNSEIKNNFGKFCYRNLPDNILLNTDGIINKGNYFIAVPERALCDKIYKNGLSYYDNLDMINKELILEISKIYNKRVANDIKKLFHDHKKRRA